MWLLDANMDVHLASVLAELGVACDTPTSSSIHPNGAGRYTAGGGLRRRSMDAQARSRTFQVVNQMLKFLFLLFRARESEERRGMDRDHHLTTRSMRQKHPALLLNADLAAEYRL